MDRKFNIFELDWFLISIVLALIFSGMILIYSASAGGETATSDTFTRQVMWFVIGIVAASVFYAISSKLLFAFSYLIYIVSLAVLALVLVKGSGAGSDRWLVIGGITIQPSEFAKIAVVLAVARYLSQCHIEKNNIKDLAVIFAIIAVPVYLIKEQPDLGTSLVLLSLIVPMLYWAGIQFFTLFALIAPFVSLVASTQFFVFLVWMLIVIAVLYFSKKTLIVILGIFMINVAVGGMTPYLWNKLKPYQQQRILSVLDPEKDPQGTNYQVMQSLNAIGSGGLMGKGFRQGTQTQLRFLPEQHNDFIFSVLGEEFGFVGVVFVLILFLILILKLIALASLQKSQYESLVVVGFASIILFHVFVNTGMVSGILPVTGLPLPFLSSGGSFLISLMSMFGIILNFTRTNK